MRFISRSRRESGEPRFVDQWMLSMGIDRMVVMTWSPCSWVCTGTGIPSGWQRRCIPVPKSAAFSETFDVVVMTLLGLTHVLLNPSTWALYLQSEQFIAVSPRITSSTRSRNVSTTLG